MARRAIERQVRIRVSFVTDPESVKAAQDILQEGFRRALARALSEKQQKDATDVVSTR